MQILDGDMYNKIRDYFVTYGKAALDVSTQEKSACESFVTESELVRSRKKLVYLHDHIRKREILTNMMWLFCDYK